MQAARAFEATQALRVALQEAAQRDAQLQREETGRLEAAERERFVLFLLIPSNFS